VNRSALLFPSERTRMTKLHQITWTIIRHTKCNLKCLQNSSQTRETSPQTTRRAKRLRFSWPPVQGWVCEGPFRSVFCRGCITVLAAWSCWNLLKLHKYFYINPTFCQWQFAHHFSYFSYTA
jgi:hypothetical protein